MKQIGAAITLLMLTACGGAGVDGGSGSSTLPGASAPQSSGASSAASGSTVGGATSTTGAGASPAGATASDAVAVGIVPTGTVPTGKMTLTTRVVDGPIQGAVVCTDKNLNGVCDAGEPQATTDATGIASFLIDAADTCKYPLLAVVGLSAIDTVN